MLVEGVLLPDTHRMKDAFTMLFWRWALSYELSPGTQFFFDDSPGCGTIALVGRNAETSSLFAETR